MTTTTLTQPSLPDHQTVDIIVYSPNVDNVMSTTGSRLLFIQSLNQVKHQLIRTLDIVEQVNTSLEARRKVCLLIPTPEFARDYFKRIHPTGDLDAQVRFTNLIKGIVDPDSLEVKVDKRITNSIFLNGPDQMDPDLIIRTIRTTRF